MDNFAAIRRARGVPHEADAPLLRVADLTAVYDGGPEEAAAALLDISFEVDTGEQVAVVGPNGAGKSTLLKVIAGTHRPKSGWIRVGGHDPGDHICIAYVPQRSQVDWSFPASVADVVMMGRVGQIGLFRRAGRRDHAVVDESLERVNAAHLAQKEIGALSGGQQQRVFLARALAQEAELVLLDEPFNGLDAPSQEALFAILRTLRADGVTVMAATHDLNLAAEHFDKVMVLNRELVAYGPPAATLTSANLLRAYGGQAHLMAEDGAVLLADGCGEGDHGAG